MRAKPTIANQSSVIIFFVCALSKNEKNKNLAPSPKQLLVYIRIDSKGTLRRVKND